MWVHFEKGVVRHCGHEHNRLVSLLIEATPLSPLNANCKPDVAQTILKMAEEDTDLLESCGRLTRAKHLFKELQADLHR